MKTIITECADNLEGDLMVTVQTTRGKEFVINAHKAAIGLANLLCDLENEKRFGWTLNPPWYEEHIAAVARAALTQGGGND